jgi:hypothetical protein
MIKKLFFLAALLVPGLAFGGNPSADLSIQIMPAGSGPTPPAGASAAGFTTLALTLDFQTNQACIGTTCVPANNLANWFDKSGAPSPMWCLGTFSAAKNVILKQDPIYNVPVLDLQFLQSDFNRTIAPFVIQTQIDTQCNSAGPSGNFLFPVMNMYAEVTMRNDASGYSACPSGQSCFLGVFWSYAPNYTQSGPFFEWDFIETAGGTQSCGPNPCIDGGIAHPDNGATYNNGGNNTFQEPGHVAHDPTQFNTYAWRNTSDATGALSSCSFLGVNGAAVSGIGCTGVGSYTPVPVPHNFLTIENGPQGGVAPIGDEHDYIKSVHIWTCAAWKTTECFTTPLTTN